MAPSRAVVAALIAAVLPATAIADRLVEAYLRGDAAEIARAGRHASAHKLEPALVSPDRPTALAAIAAAPAAEDAWELVIYMADLAGGADRPIAQAAAHSTARIAARIDADFVAERDIPAASIEKARAAWAAIAARADRWADVRVMALEIAQKLGRAADPGALGLDLDKALLDLDGEFRRAALELLPSPPASEQLARAARAAGEDPDPVVAIAAAQAVCSGLAFDDPAAPILAALGAPALERIRSLVLDKTLPITARVDAARCLAAEGSDDSRAAIARLAAGAPRRLRKVVSAMAKRPR